MYEITGILRYYTRTCQVHLDPDLIKYYRALCPKYLNIKPPKEHSHVSVVRPFEIIDEKLKSLYWSKYEGEIVQIEYWLPVCTDMLYYWINCDCARLAEIRLELGLSKYRGNFQSHHITLGNCK